MMKSQRSIVSVLWGLFALFAIPALAAEPAAGTSGQNAKPKPPDTQARTKPASEVIDMGGRGEGESVKRINGALDSPTNIDLEHVRFKDVARHFSIKHKIAIQLDNYALKQASFDPEQEVPEVRFKGISLRSALELFLKEYELACVINSEVLLLTTREEAMKPENMLTKVYPVGDLVRLPGESPGTGDFQSLIGVITSLLQRDTWGVYNGPGGISALPVKDLLVVTQTEAMHREVARLLTDIRAAGDTKAPNPGGQSARQSVTRISQALDSPTKIELSNTRFKDVIQHFAIQHDVPVSVDNYAMKQATFDPDQEVPEVRFKGISFRSALQRFLKEYELTYLIKNETLVVTTKEEATKPDNLPTKVYPVGDLIRLPGKAAEGGNRDFQSLIDLITYMCCRDTWDVNNGALGIEALPVKDLLVITVTEEAHDEIAKLLADIRAAADKKASGAEEPGASEGAKKISQALNSPTQIDLKDTRFKDVIQHFASLHGIPVSLDNYALKQATFDPDQEVPEVRFKGISLRSALRLFLKEYEVTYMIKNEVLLITTKEEATKPDNMPIKVYPVGDLVRVPGKPQEDDGSDFDSLVDTITSVVHSDAWDVKNGPGGIRALPQKNVLVVTQTHEMHDEIAKLLAEIRTANVRPTGAHAVRPAAQDVNGEKPPGKSSATQ